MQRDGTIVHPLSPHTEYPARVGAAALLAELETTMCNFASGVLTKDSEFQGPTDSHRNIIEHHGLHSDGCRGPNTVSYEITPPDDDPRAPLEEWSYRVDQDQLPEWYDPINDEARARAALARRAAAEYWFVRADGQQAQAGYAGTATAGDAGTATAGDAGTATAGYAGTATAGYAGTATAGDEAILMVKYWDGSRWRVAVGYTGEDGIESGKPYRWDSGLKRLVLAEEVP